MEPALGACNTAIQVVCGDPGYQDLRLSAWLVVAVTTEPAVTVGNSGEGKAVLPNRCDCRAGGVLDTGQKGTGLFSGVDQCADCGRPRSRQWLGRPNN